MFFNWLKHRTARKQAAAGLYQSARTQSRHPVFYANWGVADTMDGRFDVLSLHVALLMARLGQKGAQGRKLAQALFDTMFRDIEFTLRETGVGDLGVPKHMAKMMKAFNGRVHAYHQALKANDNVALETAIARNIYRMEHIPDHARDIAGYAIDVKNTLDQYHDFHRGSIDYPAPKAKEEAAYAKAV
jgi:cytochrome b pre-mRNA-processing protein 3